MPKRDVEDFISHWRGATAPEQSISQQFLCELCDLLAVPQPGNQRNGPYTFEFHVSETQHDGTTKDGRIDLYKRASFILESKKFQEKIVGQTSLELAAEKMGAFARRKKIAAPVRDTDRWDDAMLKAFVQARDYVRALPTSEPAPPFLLVVDVGHVIEVRADFSLAGRAYQPFPDPLTYRITLEQLRDEKIRERLKLIWTNPAALDPSKRSAEVTREVAKHLAELAKSFEKKHPPKIVAEFLTRCLFCMFAEDVGLLPNSDGKPGFTALLNSLPTNGEGFETMLRTLFAEMNEGRGGRHEVSVILRRKLLKFNGGLFADNTVLPVNGTQLGILKAAAALDWQHVEPAIFGTLLERALGGEGERHKLGAHFTPRSYVERLVLPTVIEPLRAEWENVRAAAYTFENRSSVRSAKAKELMAEMQKKQDKGDYAAAKVDYKLVQDEEKIAAADLEKARSEINSFHERLCNLKVLDPACGSGNFLYVALEHLKRLEGEVLIAAADFGENFKLGLEKHTVDPHQFLGLEINPRAASIAEMVLWIGYLQWHFRTRGQTLPAEPVLKNFKNIECRDAVLAYDGESQPVTWQMALENPNLPGLPDNVRAEIRSGGRAGSPLPAATANPRALAHHDGAHGVTRPTDLITVWDRRSVKTDTVTGREVPDETKRVPLLTYTNPRPATWPDADFIVGNPPFIGNKRMREDLGDGYAETLRAAYPDVPESSDFVLYWWHKAAELVRTGQARRFGLITTNSLRQTFARRVVQMHLEGKSGASVREVLECGGPPPLSLQDAGAQAMPLSLAFAIPDHPWVDTAEGAAVRIAMTVGVPGEHAGELLEVKTETEQADGSAKITFATKRGKISADLTIGTNVAAANPLKANERICYQGMNLVGEGFRITEENITRLGFNLSKLPPVIKAYQKGKELVQGGNSGWVIDCYGFDAEKLREKFPSVYQQLLVAVKPERDQNNRDSRRKNWWLFGEPVGKLRAALVGLKRYIATIETSKFKPFVFLDAHIIPDHKLYAIATDDSFVLGILSSRIHGAWATAAGGTLEDRPTWTNTTCFLPFPFPLCGEREQARIRELAEALDAHRKSVQAKHGVTLTGLYNVLEKLRAAQQVGRVTPCAPSGELENTDTSPRSGGAHGVTRPTNSEFMLTAKEKFIHDRGLVSTLKSLHDDLDAAVASAYGWPKDLSDAEILERLVALNAERAAEEARGVIHWLRPEYQARNQKSEIRSQKEMDLPERKTKPKARKSKIANRKLGWPKTLPERMHAVETALHAAAPISPADLAAQFARARPADVMEILKTLETFGRARKAGEGKFKA